MGKEWKEKALPKALATHIVPWTHSTEGKGYLKRLLSWELLYVVCHCLGECRFRKTAIYKCIYVYMYGLRVCVNVLGLIEMISQLNVFPNGSRFLFFFSVSALEDETGLIVVQFVFYIQPPVCLLVAGVCSFLQQSLDLEYCSCRDFLLIMRCS